jgi:hypothetical protein
MDIDMKKVLGIVVSSVTFLALPISSYAAGVNPCDNNTGGIPQALCTLGQNGNIGSAIGGVINLLFLVAVLVALFYLVQGGIKWITSEGDSKNVEGARNQIIAAAVGLAVTFLSYLILNLLLQFFGFSQGFGGLSIPKII